MVIAYCRKRYFRLRMLQVLIACVATVVILSCTEDAPTLTPDLERFVAEKVALLIQSDFPDLKDLTIEYLPVTEAQDTIYFETYVKATLMIWSPMRRTYQIFVNAKLSKNRPGPQAIRAILAHELIHIRDFFAKNIWQLLQLKRNYEDERFKAQYERFTDQRTIELGYGPGLIRYRRWLYRTIGDSKKIGAKKRFYMTPEEIETWIAKQQ